MAITMPSSAQLSILDGDAKADSPSLPFVTAPLTSEVSSWRNVFVGQSEFETLSLDELDAIEQAREQGLREAASSTAYTIPLDDRTWSALNIIRHQLIDKELAGSLSENDRILLGTLEIVSDRRLQSGGGLSLDKADKILAELRGRDAG